MKRTCVYIWMNQIKEDGPDVLILFVALLWGLSFSACGNVYKYSYTDLDGPYYEGDYSNYVDRKISNETIMVISYNIEFANNFKEAVDLLNSDSLSQFDVLLLQEMDPASTDSVAKALDCSYIYYPSINHPGQGKLVGNAILSRWPITTHGKVILPHPSIYPVITSMSIYKFVKIATRANIEIGGEEITFYSVHGAAFNTSKARGALAEKVSSDINNRELSNVVVGGDFNTVGYGDIISIVEPFNDSGMHWATRNIGRTIGHIRWMVSFFKAEAFQADHLFIKGLKVKEVGKVKNSSISDHYPVWIKLTPEQ